MLRCFVGVALAGLRGYGYPRGFIEGLTTGIQ